MKIMIVYDSAFGNTEQIARAIGSAFGDPMDVAIVRVSDVKPDQFLGLKLLIIGSPTQRFRPTAGISNLLKDISSDKLKGVKGAAFDTRLTINKINETPVLAFFVRLVGNAYAARTIANSVRNKGGELIVAPEGFFVEGMEGPLVQGELERAANWAEQIKIQTFIDR